MQIVFYLLVSSSRFLVLSQYSDMWRQKSCLD